MKTLKEIQTLTEAAIQKKKQAAIERRKKEEAEEVVRLKKEERDAKYSVNFFIEEIEEAAKKGERSYEIDVGELKNGELSRRLQLEQIYIQKELKDFHPVFTPIPREGPIHNYDGEIIDHRHYTAFNVSFSW